MAMMILNTNVTFESSISKIALLSKIMLLPFGRDVTLRNFRQQCGRSTRNVTKDESIESELSMPRPSNVMEHNRY